MEEEDMHHKALQTLCRVCAKKCVKSNSLKYKHGSDKCKFQEKLKITFSVDVENDNPLIHPAYLCLSCIAAFSLARKSVRPVHQWEQHDTEQCQTCYIYQNIKRGGRPQKPENVGAKRRKQREEEERKAEVVSSACDALLKLSSGPPTRKMQQVATHLIKGMITEDNTVELPTGGPKLVLRRVVQPKVDSHRASPKTVQMRSQEINTFINQVSSQHNSEEAAQYQLAKLLKGKSSTQIQELMEAHGLFKIKIPAGHELAMKTTMGWGWDELRKVKRWLAAYKIHMQCEGKSREAKKDMIADTTIQRDMLPFFVKNKDTEEIELKPRPMVSILNMKDHIMNTLNELQRNNLLTWDGIPSDEVWIKVGGDSGGGTTKFYYQILNTTKPNSKQNSTVFCCFAADESLPNLHIGLDRFTDQVNSLLSATWKDKKIVPWLCADYLMLSKLLGMQGASATYPCLFCLAKKGKLASDGGQQRSLEDVCKDFEEVQKCGCTAKAKRDNHSVSHKPFFDIPLEQVCIPGLHITLGLWDKFFNQLVGDINSLGDIIAGKLAEKSDEQLPTDNAHFNKHVAEVRKMQEEVKKKQQEADDLREKATELQYRVIYQNLVDDMAGQEDTQEITKLHKQAEKLEKEVEDIKKKHKLTDMKNPLVHQLDETLKKFKVRRQQYHGGTFIGNHVHKCLKHENYTKLLGDMCGKAANLCQDDDVIDYAESIRVKYLCLFQGFAECYAIYSKATTLSPDDISTLEMSIKNMADFYKTKFGENKFTPKFHLLLKHTVDFIRKTGVGLGTMGEQGGELLHHDFNVMGRKKEGAKNVKGEDPDLHHMFCVMEDHLVKVNPVTRSLGPGTEE